MANNGSFASRQEFASFWGKARPNMSARYPFHPAWAHGLDVAAAGRSLVRARPRTFRVVAARLGFRVEALEALWLHLLALHDIGKFSPLFQLKVPGLYPAELPRPDDTAWGKADPGHPAAGLLLLGGWLEEETPKGTARLMRNWSRKARHRFLQPIFGHHGRPVALRDDAWRSLFRPRAAAEAALFYWDTVELLLPAPDFPSPGSAAIAEASWALAGLTALADWIGSNQMWFPYVAPQTDVAAYWKAACRQADAAVLEAGLLPAAPAARLPFAALTGLTYPPTAAQTWADGEALPDGPLLVLIEDVTGGGKTEAALLLAHRLLSEGRADGLYFALPTMATANAMFDRIEAVAPRLYAATATPSLALAHGRADLHPRFRRAASGFPAPDASGQQDENEDSAAVAPAWLASESRKALLADLGVGTIDQAVLAVLSNRHGAVRLAGLAGKVLVVDEAHGYDAYLGRELERLVAFHAAGGGSTIILSATLPSIVRERLVEAWRDARGQPAVRLVANDYPLVTLVAPSLAPIEKPLAARADLRRTLAITRVPDAAAAIARIQEAAAAGACVAWVRNTVDDAIEGATALRDADLFHARFAMGDRLAIEKRVLKRFGRNSSADERRGQVIVGTQVLESSLDLDFDLIVADLAPIDSILQRAGRLWRHTHRPRPIPGPELAVVSPDQAGPIAADWVRAAFPRAAVVYRDHAILWRTARELFSRNAFRVPEDVRAAIEAVYAKDEDDMPDALVPIHNNAVGKGGAERSIANQNLLVFSDGYRPDGKGWSDEGSAPTRLVEDSRVLRLARVDGGRLVPWHADPDPRLAWALSEVTAYERKLRGRHEPEPRWQALAAAARAGWGRFEENVVLLPLEKGIGGVWGGVLVDGDGRRMELRYSTKNGLMI